MKSCLVRCPAVRPLGPAIVGPQVERISLQLEDDKWFTLGVEGPAAARGGTYRLPPPPASRFSWKHVLTIPYRVGKDRGLLFIAGNLHCFWSLSSHRYSDWTPCWGLRSIRMTLVALSVNSAPFHVFCQELSLAAHMHQGCPIPLPSTPWPPGLHRYWFEVLLGTHRIDHNSSDQATIAHWVTCQGDRLDALLASIRLGAVISAAWRTPLELAPMLSALSISSRVSEEDIDWESLPSACAAVSAPVASVS